MVRDREADAIEKIRKKKQYEAMNRARIPFCLVIETASHKLLVLRVYRALRLHLLSGKQTPIVSRKSPFLDHTSGGFITIAKSHRHTALSSRATPCSSLPLQEHQKALATVYQKYSLLDPIAGKPSFGLEEWKVIQCSSEASVFFDEERSNRGDVRI